MTVHLTTADAQLRALAIFARSLKEARRESDTDILIDGDYEWMAFAEPNRAKAIREFISHTDRSLRVADVACRRAWMRVDFDAIRDAAAHTAEVYDDPDDDYVAYTWEDGGFLWTECDRRADRAKAFWRCEVKR